MSDNTLGLAVNRANNNSNAGRGPAITTGCNDNARITYESQCAWNKAQTEKKG